MKNLVLICATLTLMVTSCSPATSTPAAESLRVEYSFAAQPWLPSLFECAGETPLQVDLRAAGLFDFSGRELAIRIGAPAILPFPAFQIGQEDLLVVVNPENPVGSLDSNQVLGLFTGSLPTWQSINGHDDPVTVWAFSPGEDIQQLFESITLGGARITSLARLATGPEEMGQAVGRDVYAIGILPRHWKTGIVSEVFIAATLPVLVIAPNLPSGATADLITCLQE